jgi:hypothetical protein
MHALPVQFHLKSLFFTNFPTPILYLAFQIIISVSIIRITRHVKGDEIVDVLGFVFPIFAVLTIVFYLRSAYTNPGYVIGNEQI